jgi:hypothetical protein
MVPSCDQQLIFHIPYVSEVNPTKIENENIYDKPEYEIVACKGTT